MRLGEHVLYLRDYLGMSVADAELQWRSILGRETPVGSKRQVDFTPLETLLCAALSLVATPSPSGNLNIKESSPAVKRLAALFRRNPSSLAAKLANLDGRRPNGAKHERELWGELTHDFTKLELLYVVILEAGRRLGIDEELLPDFLEIESGSLQAVLDADRVSVEELRDSIDVDVRAWFELHPDDNVRETERALMGTARVGQKQFARAVLNNCGSACVFCGMNFKSAMLPSARMLIAGHIKPWRDSDNRERIDDSNGLAACPTHDAAFENHLLGLDGDLRILRSDALHAAIASDSIIGRTFGIEAIGSALRATAMTAAPGASYLAWHRDQFARLAATEGERG